MLALVDGDIVAYRCAAVTANAAEGIAKWQADQLITRIVEDVNASDWKVYLSGDNNFRYSLYPDYKANRRDMVKPRWLECIREHLIREWDASIADGYEADDAIGIESSLSPSESVVCSIDKDLRQLPTSHYHFVNRTWLEVSVVEGWRNFFLQLLMGDATDNIKGCPGIGPVKAERALRDCTDESGFYAQVVKHYYEVYGQQWFHHLNLNAQLLYIWRKENDSWIPPSKVEPLSKPEGAVTPSSSPSGKATSSEHTKDQSNGTHVDGTLTVASLKASQNVD